MVTTIRGHYNAFYTRLFLTRRIIPMFSVPRFGVITFLLALLCLYPISSHAADPIATAEAAVVRFHTVCDGEISKTAPPEKLKVIRSMRESPFLMIALKTHVDVTQFLDPQFASAIEKNGLYGSPAALAQSTGNVWVLTYGNMRSMVAYVDAASGAVLCVAIIPEG